MVVEFETGISRGLDKTNKQKKAEKCRGGLQEEAFVEDAMTPHKLYPVSILSTTPQSSVCSNRHPSSKGRHYCYVLKGFGDNLVRK